jgi:hypothetical protein
MTTQEELIDSLNRQLTLSIKECARLQSLVEGTYKVQTTLAKERDEARAEVSAIRNAISDAGFSEVVEPLQRVKRLIQERDQAIAERMPHDYGILKDQRDEYWRMFSDAVRQVEKERAEVEFLKQENAMIQRIPTVRPEPSRLEIAALLMAHSWPHDGVYKIVCMKALEQADTLIAAAKEAK